MARAALAAGAGAWARHLALLSAFTLAGCGLWPAKQAPPPPAPVPAATPPPPAAMAPEPAPGLDAFVAEQRAQAGAARAQGRFPAAAMAWEAVLAVHPHDEPAAQALAEVRRAAEHVGTDRLQRARQAQQRGEVDNAMRLYLEALAANPSLSAAADALRSLEQDRARRGTTLSFARPLTDSRARAAQALQQATQQTSGANGNAEEHAALLARQGEVDAAIALLTPVAAGPHTAPTVRARLADLLVRQAERLAPGGDRAGAVAALRKALLWQPTHTAAAKRLNELQATATAPSAATWSATPASAAQPGR